MRYRPTNGILAKLGAARRAAGLIAATVLAGLAAPAIAGEIHALVIGIDRYQHGRPLRGAVNDASDIADVLRRRGVRDVTLLLDDAASRAGISAGWSQILSVARPGDTVLLTYAGHGGQEPERVKGSERDGMDEVLLLGGFSQRGPGTRERIFDDELHRWFTEAGTRGLEVVFVADACHSGTMMRGYDDRAGALSVRYAPYAVEDDELLIDVPPAADFVAVDQANVTFLAAGQDNEKVPEIPIRLASGRVVMRGALSYTFARALDGAADENGDRVLDRVELERYVIENVRMLAESRHTPELLPRAAADRAVLSLPGATAAEPVAIAPAGPLSLAVTGMAAAVPSSRSSSRCRSLSGAGLAIATMCSAPNGGATSISMMNGRLSGIAGGSPGSG
jgi:hypothetical protein